MTTIVQLRNTANGVVSKYASTFVWFDPAWVDESEPVDHRWGQPCPRNGYKNIFWERIEQDMNAGIWTNEDTQAVITGRYKNGCKDYLDFLTKRGRKERELPPL